MFSLLLVSLAVALIVLVLVALPHLQAGRGADREALSAEGVQARGRGLDRLLDAVRIAFTVLGEAVGAGMEALRSGPASGRRRPVRQHGAGTSAEPPAQRGWTGPHEPGEEPDGESLPSSGAPRHAAR